MGLFGANWRTQITNLLPVSKRSTTIIDFLASLISPVSDKSSTMDSFEVDVRKRAVWNGQALVLGKALNDTFGLTSIRVETRVSLSAILFFYNSTESFEPHLVHNTGDVLYFYNNSELDDGNDFVVLIASADHNAALEARIIAEVKRYKLAGKSFVVETY